MDRPTEKKKKKRKEEEEEEEEVEEEEEAVASQHHPCFVVVFFLFSFFFVFFPYKWDFSCFGLVSIYWLKQPDFAGTQPIWPVFFLVRNKGVIYMVYTGWYDMELTSLLTRVAMISLYFDMGFWISPIVFFLITLYTMVHFGRIGLHWPKAKPS